MANEAQLAEERQARRDKCGGGRLPKGEVGNIRGKFRLRLNELSKGDDGIRWRGGFLRDLESSTADYVSVLMNNNLIGDREEEEHMRIHWFSKTDDGSPFSPWFPHEEDLETKLRHHMIQFIQLSLEPIHHDKSLDSQWVVEPDAKEVTVRSRIEGERLVLVRTTPAPEKEM